MSLPLPHGYAARHPRLDEADALAALINLCSMADIGIPFVSVDDVRSLWQLPGHDPEVDEWLIANGDGVVVGAEAIFSLEPHTDIQCSGVVHPEHEGRGLGTWLLERVEARAAHYVALAPADSAVTLYTQSWSANQRSARLFQAHGYQLVRDIWQMQIDFKQEAPIASPEAPDGITIRTFARGQDERAAWQAHEESFADHWNQHEVAFETWLQLTIANRGTEFDPSLWWLALEGDEVVGFARCNASAPGQPDLGWVASLGVRRPWRGRGIAKALLLTTFAEFQQRGKRGVGLEVDSQSRTGADRLYLSAGMHAVMDMAVYAKELRPASS